MNDLHEYLAGLYKLHLASVALEHAVRRENDNWAIFEPSQFIYAFFTFNTLYTIDWSATREAKTLVERSQYEREYEDKIKSVIKFCLSDDNNNKFLTELVDKLRSKAPIKPILDKIKPDSQTKTWLINNFRKPIVKAVDGGEVNLTVEEYESIFYFIYKVRNNVFHGQKTTLEMLDSNQRRRFSIYTIILTSFNYRLLTYASDCGMWSKQDDRQYVGRL